MRRCPLHDVAGRRRRFDIVARKSKTPITGYPFLLHDLRVLVQRAEAPEVVVSKAAKPNDHQPLKMIHVPRYLPGRAGSNQDPARKNAAVIFRFLCRTGAARRSKPTNHPNDDGTEI